MLRIGQLDYLNVQPIYYTLNRHIRSPVTFIRDVPTELNRALINGDLDLAPISSIEVASYAKDIIILPNLSIASLGPVRSVLLFSWQSDLVKLDEGTIAISDQSATAAALLKVLCHERYNINPRFNIVPANLDKMMGTSDAALVIGDTALVESIHHKTLSRESPNPKTKAQPFIFDLSEEWFKLTRLPFVFAVWAFRKDRYDEVVNSGIVEDLQTAKVEGLTLIDDIATEYAPRLNLKPEVGVNYLSNLSYDLGPSELQGLIRFLHFAKPNFEATSLKFFDE